MQVLVAAAGAPGAAARATLTEAGFTVERVETLADARVRAATASVAVVGPLTDGDAADLRDALAEAGATTALVHLGTADGYTVSVDGPSSPDLPAAVRLARHAGAYHDAVDDLLERARARANGSGGHSDDGLAAARRRADESLDETRRVAGRTPYEYLLGE